MTTRKDTYSDLPDASQTGGIDRRYIPAILAAAIAISTVLAYWPVAGNDFVSYDDQVYLTQNAHIADGLTLKGAKWAFSSFYASNWHPLTWLSHMLDVSMFGLHPRSSHLVNLGLHITSALLLFWLLLATTRQTWASAAVAAFFALHPLHVEAVAWASERKEVLSTCFWLAAMLAYVWYVRRPGWQRYVLIVAFFACSLMSKPMAVTLPLVLLLIDYWPLRRLGGEGGVPIGRLVLEKLPLLGMSAASAIVTILAQQGAISPLETVTLPARIANASISYATYLCQMVCPVRLAVLYPYPGHPRYVLALVCALLLAEVTAAVIIWGRRSRFPIMGWLWYLVTLVPVIGLVQVGEQSHADRYTYIPLVGVFTAAAWLGVKLCTGRPGFGPVLAVLTVAALSTCVIQTHMQAGYWKNSITLFARAAAVTKDNAVAMTNLGTALAASGRLDEALTAFQNSCAISPSRAETLSGIGNVLFQNGRLPESLGFYESAAKLRPDLKDTQLNAASTLIAMGRYAEAEPYVRKALKLDAQWPQALTQLGVVLGSTGHLDEAIAACRQAVQLAPNLGAAHFTLAALCVKKGDMDTAIVEYRKCLAILPTYDIKKKLAACLLETGRKQEALSLYAEASAMQPNLAEGHFNLAKALDCLGRRSEAMEEARTALRLEPSNSDVRDYLNKLTTENR
jgi:protein O-mannosyl-transferase